MAAKLKSCSDMDRLQHFASRETQCRFAWGDRDCITFPADWVVEICGYDPMADLRGRYDSLATCQRLTGFLIDPLRVVAPRMEGLAEIVSSAVARGDVGVVLMPFGGVLQPHGAIALGGGQWIMRGLAGVIVCQPPKIAAAWRVGMVPRE